MTDTCAESGAWKAESGVLRLILASPRPEREKLLLLEMLGLTSTHEAA